VSLIKYPDARVCKACLEVINPQWIVCPGCGQCPPDAVPIKVYSAHFDEEKKS